MNDRFGKQAKRLLCGLLAFVVLAGYLPDLSAFAADVPEAEPGTPPGCIHGRLRG